MAPEDSNEGKRISKEEFDVTFNRIAVALAKREAIVKSWTAASSSKPQQPTKTDEELDAEDAILFRSQPAHLGVGAPIPAHFLENNGEHANKSLRSKLFPSRTLKASKARDAEEKAASAKRGLRHESSDEEEGRSALGKSKKSKRQSKSMHADPVPAVQEDSDVNVDDDVEKSVPVKVDSHPVSEHRSKAKRSKVEDESDDEDRVSAKRAKKQKILKQGKTDPDTEAKIQARLEKLMGEDLKAREAKKADASKQSKFEEMADAAEDEKAAPESASEAQGDIPMNAAERKRMKKRENKKKQKAKLRAAALAAGN